MIENNDWRLMNQERYLKGVPLKHSVWTPPSETWDHDHCEFCFEKFSQYEGDMHDGYCTIDEYHWICEECFEDFKDIFGWKVETPAK